MILESQLVDEGWVIQSGLTNEDKTVYSKKVDEGLVMKAGLTDENM